MIFNNLQFKISSITNFGTLPFQLSVCRQYCLNPISRKSFAADFFI